jgi:hypothetical protein
LVANPSVNRPGSLPESHRAHGEEIYDYDALDNVRRVAGYPNGLGGYVQDHRYQYDAKQESIN